ncbi:NAD(P)H-binding protein [Pseudooctadecabacter jejudonensis]|uniref:Divinyl chlorophyllide a 8-vinyl-reductase, chloroplastic n=1 Tax=Pseudooctadecabacter jejudonensis TaxID=1391910 RepID=A0A1Y5S1T9_9RHOB|nr:NAD(P)H-binding protein [Pseudooctadecabacter jejudonensis]SLN30698.1 NAD(P)H azoreductase [Pseudooctadecabacter jejudonensis]
MNTPSQSVILFGATGTIGRATAAALVEAGHAVTCVTRAGSDTNGLPAGVAVLDMNLDQIDVSQLQGIDAVVSCLASRTGTPQDAWAIDHDAHLRILKAAQAAGIKHFVLLSAICVQKPKLAFQKAKLAFESALIDSGLTYSIVRPTAFFKSLSGQVDRVKNGRPFLMFGDGERTACKPISDRDLGRYVTLCLSDPDKQNAVLPIGGPGPALTPLMQSTLLAEVLGQPVQTRKMPLWVMDGIIGMLRIVGVFSQRARDKAELAKIGRYYAAESMLVLTNNGYDASRTPEFGTDTLADHYRALVAGDVAADLGDHAVF